MPKKIDIEDITVQVEDTITTNAVIDGTAFSRGIYDLPMFSVEQIMPTQFMTRSSGFSGQDDFRKITGFSAGAGSTVTSDALVVSKTGDYRLIYTSNLSNNRTTGSVMFRVLVNGNPVHDKVMAPASSLIFYRFLNLTQGDKVEIQYRHIYKRYTFIFTDDQSPANTTLSNINVKIEDSPDFKINFEKDFVFGSEGIYEDAWGQYATPIYSKSGLPRTFGVGVARETVFQDRGTVSGPILAQSRIPIPVDPGAKVNFKGTFRLRKTGTKDEQTNSGSSTGFFARFSLWARALTKDEYGSDVLTYIETMFFQAALQGPNDEGKQVIEYVLPTLPDATIPAGTDGLFFTCSLVQSAGLQYGAGTYTERTETSGSTAPPPTAAAEMKYFGWSKNNPLEISVIPPEYYRVTKHSMSKTGVAYKNRDFFINVNPKSSICFMGEPGKNATIDIYDYDYGTTPPSRGAKLATFTANTNERKVVDLNGCTKGAIQIVKSGANDYYIEYVKNRFDVSLTKKTDPIYERTYRDIVEDVSKITITRDESKPGSAKIDFATHTLDPAENEILRVGKEVRILARHYNGAKERPSGWIGQAEYDEIFVGVITKISATYDYLNEPIVQIVAYDILDKMSKIKNGPAFADINKYMPILSRLGVPTYIDDYEFGYTTLALSYNDYLYNPDAFGDFSIIDSINMCRNTNKAFYSATRKNELKYLISPNNTGVVFSDVDSSSNNILYGEVDRKSNTEDVINQIVLNERILDQKNYKERTLSAEVPPEDFRYPETKSRTATFSNDDSIMLIGIMSKSFDVVRTVGSLIDLYDGKMGVGFKDWAESILAERSSLKPIIRGITVPIRNSQEIYKNVRNDILDKVSVTHKGNTSKEMIRGIEHTITPGKWFIKYEFSSSTGGTFW